MLQENSEILNERFQLASERVQEIIEEQIVKEPFYDYFHKIFSFISEMNELFQMDVDTIRNLSLRELQILNASMYQDVNGEAYENSYANPAYAVKKLGEYGKLLSFVYSEIRGMIVYAFEKRLFDITICNELFIEIYSSFEEGEPPKLSELEDIVYWFISDYSDVTLAFRVREQVDPSLDFATDIIMNSDLSDLRYLYYFGEFITENEVKTATFLNTMSQEKIDRLAKTFAEGYRLGFERTEKDLSIKGTVNIRYSVGFERIIRSAIGFFAEMGLKPVIYRAAVNSINKKQHLKIGYYATSPNKQYDYDHRFDQALYLDKAFNERRLSVLKVAYEEHKELAGHMAGPAVMEIFGEKPFAPESKPEACSLSEKQQKLSTTYANTSAQIVNEYIPGDERSFTIIAFPVPEIGENFESIFDETVQINTLDNETYEKIQDTIIAALDRADYVQIKGAGNNRTNLKVKMQELVDPANQTNFENCVADVNIPLGEVFTSPCLTGTTGVLNVSSIYLNELKFEDLLIELENGMVKDYTCKNFPDEEADRKYIKENILFQHETLPLGEFAIGTNTTAYVMANRYDIVYKLPILIVEKMGPHFALGDTCFSWEEDNKTYNPDGKEIAAKDNECSILRKTNPEKAYFNCHTDITIPYDELGEITAVTKDGLKIPIITNGRFVLAGTELLNVPFQKHEKVVD